MPVKADITEALESSEGEDIEFSTLEEGDLDDSEFEEQPEDSDDQDADEEVVEKETEEDASQPPKKTAGESTADQKAARKLAKELEDVVTLIGQDDSLKSKGLEAKLSDFTPEERKALFNKGLRFYQHMDELTKREATIVERERALMNASRQIQDLQLRLDQEMKRRATAPSTTPPKDLEVLPDDPPELIALKKASLDQWKRSQELEEKLSGFESLVSRRQNDEQEQAVLNEIQTYKGDFPLASPEETIAVHMLSGGRIPIRQIMQRGQQIYGSADFVKKVFAACPEVRKEVEDGVIKNYLAKQKNAAQKRVPLKPSGTGLKPVATDKKKKPVTFDNVGSEIMRSLREKQRAEEGDDL